MDKELLLKIHAVTGETVSVSGDGESVSMVPFSGEAESELFTGAVLGEGVDTQHTAGGVSRLSARYMLEGRDLAGERCRIFIGNEGVLGEGSTRPKLITDSRLLEWLCRAPLTGSIEPAEGGVCVSISEQVCGFERSELSFGTEDGRHIYGELYLPDNGEKRHPLLIASHGLNSSAGQIRSQIELIAKRGIACYAYDFCGGGNDTRSSGSTADMSIRTEQRDLRDVFGRVTALPDIDPERVYLYGESQGGFVTALTAPELNGRVRELFLVYPAFCIPHDWLGRLEELPDSEPFEFANVMLSRKYAEEVPDYDVFAQAAKFVGHITVFHGDCDPVVDLNYSRQLTAACPDAELFVCPGQGHWLNGSFRLAAAGLIADRIKADKK